MSCRFFSWLLLLSLVAINTSIEAGTTTQYDEFRHEARVMGRLGNHPNVVQFIGAVTTGASISNENPLAVDQMEWVENVVQSTLDASGQPNGVQSISFELFNLGEPPSVSGNGVVHRDIAARNILVSTTGGDYASAANEVVLFGNDGGPSLRGVGPVRWMAPESLRLFSTDPSAGPEDYFEILAGSSFTATYAVPEPSSMVLVIAGVCFLDGRCRQ